MNDETQWWAIYGIADKLNVFEARLAAAEARAETAERERDLLTLHLDNDVRVLDRDAEIERLRAYKALADEMAEWIENFGGDFEWSDESGALIQDEGIKGWLARHAALTAGVGDVVTRPVLVEDKRPQWACGRCGASGGFNPQSRPRATAVTSCIAWGVLYDHHVWVWWEPEQPS